MGTILEAAELKFALEWGYADLTEAKAWADKKIMKFEIANIDIIDLSLANSIPQAITILGKLSNKVDSWRTLRQFFKRFLTIKKIHIQKAQNLAEHLYMKSCYEKNVPEDMEVFNHHWDAISGSLEGWSPKKPDEAVSDFINDIRAIARKAP